MAKLRTLHLYREDFKSLSDGLSAFDNILDRFDVPEEQWALITELEFWHDDGHIVGWNKAGTRITS